MKTIGARVSDEVKDELDKIGKANELTTSDIILACIDGIMKGHYIIDNKELVPTDTYLEALTPDIPSGVVRWLDILHSKGYPDGVINKICDGMVSSAYDTAKYNPRRANFEDGC